MKRIPLLLSIFVFLAMASGPLFAQSNPFLGTWTLNVAKSKIEPGPGPKSLTRTVVADGAGANYSFEDVACDGKPISYSFSTKYDGKDTQVSGSGMPGGADSIAIKPISGNKSTAVLKKGGKEVASSEVEVSKDGKVTTVKSRGKLPDGTAKASTADSNSSPAQCRGDAARLRPLSA
jgi:hypothetical protein